jgi:hypothetical protein
MEKNRNYIEGLDGKPVRKRPFGAPRGRWEDSIITYCNEIERKCVKRI